MTDLMKNKLESGREYRTLELTAKEDNEECIVEGYASTFNEPYLLWEGNSYQYYEVVDSNAFSECDMSDVIFQFDHEGKVFARTRNNTLEVTTDEHGLKIRANLGGTEDGRKLYQEIKDGYIDRMSFGFRVKEDEELIEHNDDMDVVTRRITNISKLYDVSAVSIPANDMTQISARNRFNGFVEKVDLEKREAEKKENEKRRIQLQIEIIKAKEMK